MKDEPTETKALTAALEAPTPFQSRATSMALHASERHVERWAPEGGQGAPRSRSLRSLAFVDRLVSPWVEAAQKSASLRVFDDYAQSGWGQRAVAPVSWVFPRPWYQDELDWMAAARQVSYASPGRSAMAVTTRGTYVQTAPSMAAPAAMPMELVAPSLSIASTSMQIAPDGGIGNALPAVPSAAVAARPLAAYSPLVPFAAAQAAQVFAGTIGQAISSGLSTAERSPILGALSFVAPAELRAPRGREISAPEPASEAPRFAAPRAAAPAPSTPAMQAQLATAIRQIEEVRAQSRAQVEAPAQIAAPSATAPSMTAPSTTAETITQAQAEAPRTAETARELAPSAAPTISAPTATATQETIPGAMSPAAIASLAQTISSSPAAASAFRAIELLARGAAAGVAPEPAGGPRVAMPAGLGGLVSGVDTASVVRRPMTSAVPAMAMAAHAAAPSAPAREAATTEAAARPSFAPVWAMPAASAGALGAIAAERPAAVEHVAWADRWLARFAGASPQSLAAIDAVTAPMSFASSPLLAPLRMRASAAPDAVYVAPAAPDFRRAPEARSAGDVFETRATARPAARAPIAQPVIAPEPAAAPPIAATPTPTPAAPPASAPRFDDAESVPDDVYAAIFRPQAAPQRPAPRATAPAAPAPAAAAATATPASTAPAGAPTVNTPSVQLVDRIARTVPSAPGAGMHAALASSPIAPALSSLLALPSAPSFDTRALYTDGLVASYLDGVLAPAMRFATTGGAAAWPTLAHFGHFATPEAAISAQATMSRLASLAPEAAYVAPELPGAPATGRELGPTGALGEERIARRAPSIPTPATAADRTDGAIAPSTTSAASAAAPAAAATTPAASAPFAAARAAEMIAVRSQLLASPIAEMITRADASPTAVTPSASIGAAAGSPSTIGASAMGLDAPLAQPPRTAWTGAPGMTAVMAQSWAVEQERSSADLSFDFVAPEIVLAARVYGFGPAEAAQAQRLAIAGPSGLAAMATAIDLTFLRAVQAGSDVQTARAAAIRAGGAPSARALAAVEAGMPVVAPSETASPEATRGAIAGATMPGASASPGMIETRAPDAIAAPITAYPSASASSAASAFAAPAPGERAQLFGIEKRLPRGAFLWPAATVGAVGLRATTPEGLATLPVAALELLAASAVADLGSWVVSREVAAASDPRAASRAPWSMAASMMSMTSASSPDAATYADQAVAPSATSPASAAAPASTMLGSLTGTTDAADAGLPAGEPGLATVSAAALPSPMLGDAPVRRRFESVYLALSQSSDGRSLSPSARAARALAILSRPTGLAGDERAVSPTERAAAAWSMIPLVLSGERERAAAKAEIDDSAPLGADVRPGLASLASRAGDALGSLVAPSTAELRSVRGAARPGARFADTDRTYVESSEPPPSREERAAAARPEREVGAVLRAPTASPELVRTGVPFARHGGGEAEIPPWFESAARKVLGSYSPGSDLSVADLTLVTAAPSRAQASIAADARGSSSRGAPSSPGAHGGQSHGKGEKPDIEKIAQDVYAEILRLIDIARERNGEPYL